MQKTGTHWIDVSSSALRHNLGVIRSALTKDTLVAGVVKANAYGHGLEQVVPAISQTVDWLAVHSASEARAVRNVGFEGPLLVMGFAPSWELHGLDGNVHVMVSTPKVLDGIADFRERTGVAMPVHIKVETGTHRQGVPLEAVPRLIRYAATKRLDVVGIATHFANIEDTLNHDFARQQMTEFEGAVEAATRELGERPPFVHAACSAAALLFPESDYTLARVGISMYGQWPSRETRLSWILKHRQDAVDLRPALTWTALVGQIQTVSAGGTVSYGRTWTALRPTRLAVLPVGYSDGYSRALGNRARVLVRGVPAPVVGRVCMNITLVDVTDVPGAALGDEAVLIGRQGAQEVTAEELASLTGTINYELLARLSQTTPRRLVD